MMIGSKFTSLSYNLVRKPLLCRVSRVLMYPFPLSLLSILDTPWELPSADSNEFRSYQESRENPKHEPWNRLQGPVRSKVMIRETHATLHSRLTFIERLERPLTFCASI